VLETPPSPLIGICTRGISQWEIWWVKLREVILPNHDFKFSVQQSIPQLRKNHTIKPLVTGQFSGAGFQCENFRKIANILGPVRILFSIYILIRKVF
jgi:hypothetical protein